MKDLYSVADFLENEDIELMTISNIVDIFNQAFVASGETFSKNEFLSFSNDMVVNRHATPFNGAYTSFNVADYNKKLSIVFPLYDNLKGQHNLITEEDSLENFYGLINHLKESFKIKVNEESNLNKLFKTKKTSSKNPKITVNFSDKIYTPDGKVQELCNTEKLVKIIDTISNAYVTKLYSKVKNYYPTKVKFCTQLLADYLLISKLKFTNEIVKHKLCKAIGLQFCNRLNTCDLSDVNVIITLGRRVSDLMNTMIDSREKQANKEFLSEMKNQFVNEEPIYESKPIEEENDYDETIEEVLTDVDFVDVEDQKNLKENDIKLLMTGDYNTILKNLPAIAKKNNTFKESTYNNAFDKMLVQIIKKRLDSIEKKIPKLKSTNKIDENRRVRQYLAYFCLKYNQFITNKKNTNINIDEYLKGFDVSDETKAFQLAESVYNIRKNSIEFIKANFELLNDKTPKQKLNFIASYYGKPTMTSYVNEEITASIKELVGVKQKNNQNVNKNTAEF